MKKKKEVMTEIFRIKESLGKNSWLDNSALTITSVPIEYLFSVALSDVVPQSCSLTVLTCDVDVIVATSARLMLTQITHTILIHCQGTQELLHEVGVCMV